MPVQFQGKYYTPVFNTDLFRFKNDLVQAAAKSGEAIDFFEREDADNSTTVYLFTGDEDVQAFKKLLPQYQAYQKLKEAYQAERLPEVAKLRQALEAAKTRFFEAFSDGHEPTEAEKATFKQLAEQEAVVRWASLPSRPPAFEAFLGESKYRHAADVSEAVRVVQENRLDSLDAALDNR